MISRSSRNRIPRSLPGLLLASLMLSSLGCALSKPLPELKFRERVVQVPATYTQPLEIPALQGKTNEDLERQRNECLVQLRQGNTTLERIRRWSDEEVARSASPLSPPSTPPAAAKPSSFQLLKTNLQAYLQRKGDEP